jgi:hypothetical protein
MVDAAAHDQQPGERPAGPERDGDSRAQDQGAAHGAERRRGAAVGPGVLCQVARRAPVPAQRNAGRHGQIAGDQQPGIADIDLPAARGGPVEQGLERRRAIDQPVAVGRGVGDVGVSARQHPVVRFGQGHGWSSSDNGGFANSNHQLTTAPSGNRQFVPSETARRLLDVPSLT